MSGRELFYSAGEGASRGRPLLDLLLMETEGLEGDGGCLGHGESLILGQVRGGDEQSCHLAPPGDRLGPV